MSKKKIITFDECRKEYFKRLETPSGALPPLEPWNVKNTLTDGHFTMKSVYEREAALKQRLELWEQLLHPTNGVNRIAWIREQIRQTKEELDGGRKTQ